MSSKLSVLAPTRSTRTGDFRSSTFDTVGNSRDVLALFTRTAAISALLVIASTSVRGVRGPKTWDKVGFVAAAGTAVLLGVWFTRGGTPRPSRIALMVCVGSFIWGAATVERPSLTSMFWEGFGVGGAVVMLAAALFLLPLSRWIAASRWRAHVAWLVLTPLVAIQLLSLVRDTYDFGPPTNNMFILNEVLAPAAGRVPGSNFIPQYTSLFGWFFVPLRGFLTPENLVNTATVVLSVMGVATVVLAVVMARRCLAPRLTWLILLVLVPITTVTVGHDPLVSSIGSYFQELSLRIFPAMVCTLVAVRVLEGLLRGVVHERTLVALGALGALLAWDSQDIGVVLAIATAIVLQLAARGVPRKRVTALWLGGSLLGVISYPLWALAVGHALNAQYFALTARSFGGGFGSALMQIPGPVLMVLPAILGVAVVGCSLLFDFAHRYPEATAEQRYAVSTLAFVGLWSLGFLPYYVNRSYASGQLQVFLLPMGLCALIVWSLVTPRDPVTTVRRRSHPVTHYARNAVWLLPVTLPVTLGVGALLQTPSATLTVRDLLHAPPDASFASVLTESEVSATTPGAPVLTAEITHEIAVMRDYVRGHGGGSIGYLGPNANYVRLVTGVQSRILYDDPADFTIGAQAYQLGCSFVLNHPTKWLVTSPGVTSLVGAHVCDRYGPVAIATELPGTIFQLRATGPRGSS